MEKADLIPIILAGIVLGGIIMASDIIGQKNGGSEWLSPSDLGKIQYKNKWLSSYETLGFDTLDGDLDFNQYALDESGKGYFIRTKPKNESQFEWVNLSYDVSKLKEVKIVGKAYYDEFLTASGATALWKENKTEIPSEGIIRLPSTGKKYWDTATIKDYPQPKRIEMVSELPPPEPKPTSPEHQSIAFDATSNSGGKSTVSSYSWSHTCTGDNRLLVVGDSHYHYIDRTVTGITYNGDAMTSIRSDVNSLRRSTLYYMVAPDTGGAYTIVVTLSGSTQYAVGGAISYIGAAQTGQPDANNGANGVTTTATVTLTTVADNCWVVSVVMAYDPTITCNNMQRWNVVAVVMSGGGSDTNGPKTPAGDQTMSWSGLDIGDSWAISAASFAPAEEAPPANTTPSVFLYNHTNFVTSKTTPGIDFNFTDDDNFAKCYLLLNGTARAVNSSTVKNIRTTLVTNTTLSSADYNVTVTCSDGDPGNRNASKPVVMTVDATKPQISFIFPTPNNDTNLSQDNYFVNVSINEPSAWAAIELTNTSGTKNYTMTKTTSTNWWFNVTGQSNNKTYFYVYANDTAGNLNRSLERFVNISVAVGDTCDCSSIQAGNPINCAENCDIEACNAGGVDITITGTGHIYVDGDVTNYGRLLIIGTDAENKCIVVCGGGCFK